MTVSLLHSVPADGSFSAAGAAAWDAQHVLTQATDRLLGRTTAGVGATEEISVGAGLTLSGGTLVNAGATSPIGGSNTQVQFNDGGVFAGNANFTFNKTTNQIAIAAGSAAAPTLIPTGDTNTGMWFPAADTVAWSTGGLERIRVDSSGNVGVATPSPTLPLTIGPSDLPAGVNISAAMITSENTGTNPVLSLRLCGSTGNAGIGQFTSSGTAAAPTIVTSGRLLGSNNWYGFDGVNYILSSSIRAQVDTVPGVNDMPGRLTFLLRPAAGSALAERMRITNAGNVGIGTTAPDALLSVNGIASFGAGAVATPSIAAFGDLNTGFWFPAADTIAASTAGSERLRVDANGNVVINTAAIATTATNGFLYVPSCAGTPTGTPTTFTGRVPIVVDTTNNKLYFYSSGQWRDAGP